MALIEMETRIRAPRARVFDLARSIDAHQESTPGTAERAVAGRTSGLLEMGEKVTWEARHFGIRQRLTVKMTAFQSPSMFEDSMEQGAFASMCHRHTFREQDGATLMHDHFEFRAPLGLLGRLAEILFLTAYMKHFLRQRNRILKQMAESEGWKAVLPAPKQERH